MIVIERATSKRKERASMNPSTIYIYLIIAKKDKSYQNQELVDERKKM